MSVVSWFKKSKIVRILLILGVLQFQTACMGMGLSSIVGSGVEMPTGSDTGSDGITNGATDSNEGGSSEGSIDSESDGELIIQASIPPPNLEAVVVSSNFVVQGGGLDHSSGDYLVATDITSSQIYLKEQNTFLAKAERAFIDPFKTGLATLIPEAAADESNPCNETAFVTCIPIDADGNIEDTPLNGFEEGHTVYFSYYDSSTGNNGDLTEDVTFTNLAYIGQTAASEHALTSDGTNLYQVDDEGNIAKMTYDSDDNLFRVEDGEFDDGYLWDGFGYETNDLYFDDFNHAIVTRSDAFVKSYPITDSGLGEFSVGTPYFCFDADGVCTSANLCSEADGCSPSFVKVKNGNTNSRVLIGTEYSTTQSDGRIRDLYYDDGTAGTYIEFMNHGNSYNGNSDIGYNSTKAFDMNYADDIFNDYLVVFEDRNNNLWLTGTIYDSGYDSQYISLTDESISTVKDLILVQPQTDFINGTDNGKAIMLTNNKLYFITYNLVDGAPSEEISLGTSIDITSPVAMTVDDETSPTYAYVLSNGQNSSGVTATDDYITVIDLANEQVLASAPVSSSITTDIQGQFQLASFLTDKTISDFNATTIHHIEPEAGVEYLVVGSSELNSGLVIPLQ